MPTLIMQNDAGKETLRVTIRNIEPSVATIAVLEALNALTPAKKTRSDKGTKRGPKPPPFRAGGDSVNTKLQTIPTDPEEEAAIREIMVAEEKAVDPDDLTGDSHRQKIVETFSCKRNENDAHSLQAEG